MLRTCHSIALLLAIFSISILRRSAFAEPTSLLLLPTGSGGTPGAAAAELPPPTDSPLDGATPLSDQQPTSEGPSAWPPSDEGADADVGAESPASDSIFSKLKWLGLHHYAENGRNVGMGIPLVGTSWLNRPYYVGGDIGPIWLTRQVKYDVSSDTDVYGGVFGGWDWDYYWGTELGVHRATPELINANAPDANRGDRLMEWTACLMYYPWGDSVFRPYWRCGIGATQIDYPTDGGHRRDEDLWTFPIGIGLKYPLRHWLAARAEFADQLALGNSGVATQHDFTLTFALEWRFGAHPRSYWPWNPSRHIW